MKIGEVTLKAHSPIWIPILECKPFRVSVDPRECLRRLAGDNTGRVGVCCDDTGEECIFYNEAVSSAGSGVQYSDVEYCVCEAMSEARKSGVMIVEEDE